MDSFGFDNVKVEKAYAMLKYCGLGKITNVLRLFEVFVALVLVSWSSIRLPGIVEISGGYLKQLSTIIFSPGFVFLIGNAIIITLFAKSGQFSDESENEGKMIGSDADDELAESNENHLKIISDGETPVPAKAPCSENAVSLTHPIQITEPASEEKKRCNRTQSEKFERRKVEPKLRRSETENCRKLSLSGEKPVKMSYPDDNMSSEEFRRKIEAFIAKQQRFLREESLSIVLRESN